MAETTIYCSTCGAANRSQATFCFSCGKPIDHGTGPISKTQIPVSGTVAPSRATTSPGAGSTGVLTRGQRLRERYHILSLIGRGGMGAVYKAEDSALGQRLVAIKEMSMGAIYPQEVTEAAENFKQEALMLAKLQHANLPSIYDHFSENGRWYLVMSYIEGESLEHELEKSPSGKLAMHDVLQIGIELCNVLDYLHSHQPPIIFRDLKPSNIMRTTQGAIYLIDFGIARHFKPGQARDTANYGTAGYAPPEQFGKAQTTPRSDIYSLGVTLHQLLSGRDPSLTPFKFPSLQSLGITVPVELENLLTRMLSSDVDFRPASMLEVKRALQKIGTSPSSTGTREQSPKHIPTVSAASLAPTRYAPPTPQQASPTIHSGLPQKSHSSSKLLLMVGGIVLIGIIIISLVVNSHLPAKTSSYSGSNNTIDTTPTSIYPQLQKAYAGYETDSMIPNDRSPWALSGIKEDASGNFTGQQIGLGVNSLGYPVHGYVTTDNRIIFSENASDSENVSGYSLTATFDGVIYSDGHIAGTWQVQGNPDHGQWYATPPN
ncbi:protein kinase domain-containing protein [Dictyobacter formicarum]|uniref:non-specific serine/threonine protein kinase n=1 Tax=Dictyobacter formicarum TaxID=2778368 RepID=A0ABQ3VQ05_9CHLR|nr:protein kinase [Dictyobacter formicarum]GHO87683.1 hypothetical protein KSZ_56890 [Dictyobacter formicarum]